MATKLQGKVNSFEQWTVKVDSQRKAFIVALWQAHSL